MDFMPRKSAMVNEAINKGDEKRRDRMISKFCGRVEGSFLWLRSSGASQQSSTLKAFFFYARERSLSSPTETAMMANTQTLRLLVPVMRKRKRNRQVVKFDDTLNLGWRVNSLFKTPPNIRSRESKLAG